MATYKKEDMSKTKPDIFSSRTKEWDSMKGKYRQYRSTQGRRPSQVEGSYKVMGLSMACVFIMVVTCSILQYFGLL